MIDVVRTRLREYYLKHWSDLDSSPDARTFTSLDDAARFARSARTPEGVDRLLRRIARRDRASLDLGRMTGPAAARWAAAGLLSGRLRAIENPTPFTGWSTPVEIEIESVFDRTESAPPAPQDVVEIAADSGHEEVPLVEAMADIDEPPMLEADAELDEAPALLTDSDLLARV